MRRLHIRHKYAHWDGTQARDAVDADDLMGALADDLMEYGDLRYAMRNLLSRGMRLGQGRRMQGLRNMLRQLREQKKQRLERFNLGGVMEDIRRKLEEILALERAHIDAWIDGTPPPAAEAAPEGTPEGSDSAREGSASAPQRTAAQEGMPAGSQGRAASTKGAGKRTDGAPGDTTSAEQGGAAGTDGSGAAGSPGASDFSRSLFKGIAERSRQALDALPEDPAGRMRALEKYEFLNPEAKRRYDELVASLRQAVTQTFFDDVSNMLKKMSAGDIQRMKEMLKALNDMLVRRIGGEDPGFDQFMQQYGDMFGDNPPKSLDELLQRMREQMAAAASLLASLSPAQRAQLQSMLADRFGDPELESELRKLAKEMDFLDPDGRGYDFQGGEAVDLQAAMQLMKEMQDLDNLIGQVAQAERDGGLDEIDAATLEKMLGREAGEDLDEMKRLMDQLIKAGYVREEGDELELTARGSRMIGQKALGEIYARLKRQALGNHAIPDEGRYGERLDQTKPYEFGDPFHLHMTRTLRNAMDRDGPGVPLKLRPQDFEIHRSELVTSTATAMLIDLSWSMTLRGSFPAAKKVALALHNLITSQYPKDSFHIIGFAAYARELKPRDLPFLQGDEYTLGTNMQHALLLAQKLLAKHPAGTRQIIMISDGEPTAHLEDGEAVFAYPPTWETIRATLRAVHLCTRHHIAINTFMLDSNGFLKAFMDRIAKINGGRVFYTSPDQLGEYILVDYVQHKRRKLARRA